MNSSNRFSHLASFALESPWAITPGVLRDIVAAIIAERIAGQRRDADTIAAAVDSRRPSSIRRGTASSTVAVLPLFGVIAPRMNLFTETSGGTTFEALTAQLRALVRDPAVSAIVLDVDSPGGNVQGATEFAKEVRDAAAAGKPVVAVANHVMASAGYWVCAGATEIVATPSAVVGSIGVYTLHDDLSAALAQLGIKRSYISAGKHKIDGVETEPLSIAVRARIQQKVDLMYARMVDDIAKGRRVPARAVREGFGQGDTLFAEEALSAGLVDRIATLDDTIARVAAGPTASPRVVAQRTAATQAALAPYREMISRAQLATHRRALAQYDHESVNR